MKKTRGMGCAMRGGGVVGKGAGESKYFRSGSMVNKPIKKFQGGGMAGGLGSLPMQAGGMQRPSPMANPRAAAAIAAALQQRGGGGMPPQRPPMPQMPQRPPMPAQSGMGMKKGGRVRGR